MQKTAADLRPTPADIVQKITSQKPDHSTATLQTTNAEIVDLTIPQHMLVVQCYRIR